MCTQIRLYSTLLLVFFASQVVFAQSQIVQDYSRTFEVPQLKTVKASSTHLYALSGIEGMAVFRAYQDSLQWLYTSSGMQRRGSAMDQDIRFAYLFGDSRRLTVLEPTSVLGVYSSTLLPARPLGVARLANELYIALGSNGLGKLLLDSPETVDSEVQIVENGILGRASVLDVVSSMVSNQLFILTDDRRVHVFLREDEELEFSSTVALNAPVSHLFIDEELIWGTTDTGDVFEINANGQGRNFGNVREPVSDLFKWNGYLLVRTASGKVWLSGSNASLRIWKEDGSAGNHIAKSGSTAWISSYDKLTPLKIFTGETTASATTTSGPFKIKPIENIILTYPSPLLLAIELENGTPDENVEFSYRSSVKNAQLKKQGFYWQPTVNQVGFNWFTIIATNTKGEVDSTRFSVDVRTFNAPPRFSPVRNSSVVVNDRYELRFNAVDPESPKSPLIRYIGVDLPDGADVNERTGLFTWTPAERQVGEHTFRVIATDQQGAAASQEVTLTVLDISREGN